MLVDGITSNALYGGAMTLTRGVLGLGPEPSFEQRLDRAIDGAVAEFRRSASDDLHDSDETFLARQSNWDAIARSLFMTGEDLTVSAIDPRGFRNVRAATSDEVQLFIDVLERHLIHDIELERQIAVKRGLRQLSAAVELLRTDSRSEPALQPPSVDEFLAEASIAGHLRADDGHMSALLLDESLYVHRSNAEAMLIEELTRYLELDGRQGRWVSILGSAGRGKTCLLWYLLSLVLQTGVTVFAVQGQTYDVTSLAAIKDGLVAQPQPTIVLIDTLDIMLGHSDDRVAAALNGLRAAGALVITTCRVQEARELAVITPPDVSLELGRFTEAEAWLAIRAYVARAYPHAAEEERLRQSDQVWGLLDHRRAIQELDFEPLILRMMFESYAPSEIPQDINTQRIYDEFWASRVMVSRATSPAQARARSQLCLLVARLIGFEDVGEGDSIGLEALAQVWVNPEGEGFSACLDVLVSNGVLQFARAGTAIRFFHQTFLEYAAAKWLGIATSAERESRLSLALGDVASSRLFRAPMLKQYLVQNGLRNAEAAALVDSLLRLANAAAVQIVVEAIGKTEPVPETNAPVLEAIHGLPSELWPAVYEASKYFPATRGPLVAVLLGPFLESSLAAAILNLFEERVVRSAPAEVVGLLDASMPWILGRSESHLIGDYKDAVCAAWKAGEPKALEILARLFPSLTSGQQAGALEQVADTPMLRSTEDVVRFYHLAAECAGERSQGEVWHALRRAIQMLSDASPTSARRLVADTLRMDAWRVSDSAAQFWGQMAGSFLPRSGCVTSAIAGLRDGDFRVRLFCADYARAAARFFPNAAMEELVSLDPSSVDEAGQRFVLRAFSGVETATLSDFDAFVERWGKQSSAEMDYTFQDTVNRLAHSDPPGLLDWSIRALSEPAAGRNTIAATAILELLRTGTKVSCEHVLIMSGAAAQGPRLLTMHVAEAVGPLAMLDEQAASTLLDRIWLLPQPDYRRTAINSLTEAAARKPDFVLGLAPRVFAKHRSARWLGLRLEFIRLFVHLPPSRANDWLSATEKMIDRNWIDLSSEAVAIGLLRALQVWGPISPARAVAIAERVPCSSRAVEGALGAFYTSVIVDSAGDELIRTVLERTLALRAFSQQRLRHAVTKILVLIDRRLGHHVVQDGVLRTYPQLEEADRRRFLTAAVRTAGWSQHDTAIVLEDASVSEGVRAALLSHRLE